jgi:HSP20 family protein
MEETTMLPIMHRNQWLPEVFNDFFNTDFMPKVNATAPAINVKESDKDYQVELAAPGLKKEDFSVNINDDGNLVIKMEKKEENKEENKASHYLRREFSFSKYEQTLILPDDVEKEEIRAKMENGVLTIDLPKMVVSQKKPTRQIVVG